MTLLRRRLRKFVWLALVAMCGVAFGPTISRSLSVASGVDMAMHADCTHMGAPMHMAGMAGHGTCSEDHPVSGHSSHPMDCCALCAVASSPFTAVVFQLPEFAPQAVGNQPVSGDADASSKRLEHWSSAPPRGPPLRS